MKKATKIHPRQTTIQEFLEWRVFTEAKQIWIQEMYFGDNPVPTYTGSMGYAWLPQDYHELQERQYYVYLQVEKLLKRIAKHRKIKRFKPDPWQIYKLIGGEIKFESLMKGVPHEAE